MDEDQKGEPSPLLMTAAEMRMVALIQEQIKREVKAREIAEVEELSDEEILQIREMLTWWTSFKAVGKLSTIAGEVLRWGGWVFGAWIAWKAGVLASFLGHSGGKP